MKYSWFINLTTGKQTMVTRGVRHPLLPNTGRATRLWFAAQSAPQQRSAIRRHWRQDDIQVNAAIPHSWRWLGEIRWRGSAAGSFSWQTSSCRLSCRWRRVNNASTEMWLDGILKKEGENALKEEGLMLSRSMVMVSSCGGKNFCWWHSCENEDRAWLMLPPLTLNGKRKSHYKHNFLHSFPLLVFITQPLASSLPPSSAPSGRTLSPT